MKDLVKKLILISFIALISTGAVEALQSFEIDMNNRTYSNETIFLKNELMGGYNIFADNYILEKISIRAQKGQVLDEPSLELIVGGQLVDWENVNPNRLSNRLSYTNTVLENRAYSDGTWQLNVKSVAKIDKITVFVRNKQQFIMPTLFSAGILETKTLGSSQDTFYFNNLFAYKLILKGCGGGARVHGVNVNFSDGSSRVYTRLNGSYMAGKIREIKINKRIHSVEVMIKPIKNKMTGYIPTRGAVQVLISGY